MNIFEMHLADIDCVLPLYIDYYNNHENGCWTEETARKKDSAGINHCGFLFFDYEG